MRESSWVTADTSRCGATMAGAGSSSWTLDIRSLRRIASVWRQTRKTPHPFGYGAGYWWPTRPTSSASSTNRGWREIQALTLRPTLRPKGLECCKSFFLVFAVCRDWPAESGLCSVSAGPQPLIPPDPGMGLVGSTFPRCNQWQVAGRSKELLHGSVGNRCYGLSAEGELRGSSSRRLGDKSRCPQRLHVMRDCRLRHPETARELRRF